MLIIQTFVEAHSKFGHRSEVVADALAESYKVLRGMKESFGEFCKYRAEVRSIGDVPPSAEAATAYLAVLMDGVRYGTRLDPANRVLTAFICHQLAPRATVALPRHGGAD
jgi:hypothetical protein